VAERVGLSSTDLPDARNPINKRLSAAGENRCVPPVCTTFRGLRQASWLSWRPAVACMVELLAPAEATVLSSDYRVSESGMFRCSKCV
jgi:hypothetical protein